MMLEAAKGVPEVVAVGLGGAEDRFPPDPFAPLFAAARQRGLHSAPHAGEDAGATSVRRALGNDYGSPAQAALRFVLGNRDFASRIIGISTLADLDEALKAVEAGPLPSQAITKLEGLWPTDFH